jgi:D-3-phosphoglycerate dehydrogenase / 2-oxoglutarate reductase
MIADFHKGGKPLKRMKILASDGIVENAVEKIRSMGCQVDEASYSPEELPEKLREYDALILRSATKITQQIIDKMGSDSKLKLIVRAGVGLDNIDVAYARENGIEVHNTPNSSAPSVAELTIGHMITLARHLLSSNITMRQGKWNKKLYEGRELRGSMLGIIGLGRIGHEVAQRAAALGMKVQYNKRSGPEKGAEAYQFVDFETLISTSDFITLHVPKIEGTPPILGQKEFSQMKKGAYIINCARGGVIDESALLEALDSGKIAGAGLDVFENEPPVNEALISHDKISLSPHIGASTAEAQERIGEELIELLQDFCERSGS